MPARTSGRAKRFTEDEAVDTAVDTPQRHRQIGSVPVRRRVLEHCGSLSRNGLQAADALISHRIGA
jgi:hypothetical protein